MDTIQSYSSSKNKKNKKKYNTSLTTISAEPEGSSYRYFIGSFTARNVNCFNLKALGVGISYWKWGSHNNLREGD